ncbi:MAG: HAMP domain-containing protein [Treponema sp.]|jgi:nitrogen fixation/metabolism regulation signal transduction histidine kinase|nr:HAMP domain-containing protein [Treponema sp.]
MKSVRTRPKHPVISVRGLVLIYFLLCILTVLFSRSFFSETLRNGRLPGPLSLIVFFTIPAVLLAFLAGAVINLFRDIVARRIGSKFKVRLLSYFIIIVVFAAAPVTIITGISLREIYRFWRNVDTASSVAAAEGFALDNYALHTEKFEALIRRIGNGPVTAPLPPEIGAVQDFYRWEGDQWEDFSFTGEPALRLADPPALQQGFVSREIPRDRGLIRYVVWPGQNHLRVISYNLGPDFDKGLGAIQNEKAYFEIIDSIMTNLRPFIIFYYGIFFFPALLMTLIIAISFTRRVTAPIVELTEATRRVAEGDFSIQILARRGDELGLLIRSFNAMVQDLDKSRAALVKAEKISIWQSMAQQLAHEIKNPLTPIKLSAERVLRRWQNEPERIGEILESSMLAIIQETEGLSTLLTEFRTLSKPTEPSQTWTGLRELVEETIGPYLISHPGVQFETTHVNADISVKIDRHRISQILTNLIINAIDAMAGKGIIEIRADKVKKRDRAYCRLSIRDSGRGISRENGPLIFTPYFTTKKTGTGLGLPIVEQIVNDHGGAIWYNSAEGMGTTFFIDLPIDEAPVETAAGGTARPAIRIGKAVPGEGK